MSITTSRNLHQEVFEVENGVICFEEKQTVEPVPAPEYFRRVCHGRFAPVFVNALGAAYTLQGHMHPDAAAAFAEQWGGHWRPRRAGE